MKKIILFFSFLILITGCGTKKKELMISQVSKQLQMLTNEELDIQALPTILKDISQYDIYRADEILEQTGLGETMYQSIFFCKAKEGVESILVIQPKKEDVEEIIHTYWEERIASTDQEEEQQLLKNRVEQKYGNYLIYIVGKDATKQLEKIKELKEKVFPNMISMKKADLQTIGLDVEKLGGYVFAKSSKLNQVYQYLIVKAQDETSIKQIIHNYFEGLEEEWKEKDSKQYQLLKNRMEKTLDSYLIYLVSNNNERAFELIKEQYK